ncbi:hypothetical protein PILCRDRAFT_10920 [Piloderma croceum F 1598]|uniref:Uncharacterized protein n=1 Tax=Piloderma croceum (strain F 1598) TaxID=765440 RepID=A0A0C3F1R0_PILCF|nr:hypothetical protein PILCRDRAFT_10920 [Piloderma croceum F 1598]
MTGNVTCPEKTAPPVVFASLRCLTCFLPNRPLPTLHRLRNGRIRRRPRSNSSDPTSPFQTKLDAAGAKFSLAELRWRRRQQDDTLGMGDGNPRVTAGRFKNCYLPASVRTSAANAEPNLQRPAQSFPVTPATVGSLTLPSTPELNTRVFTNEAISFLVEALEDPLKPRWCGPSIAASMEVICVDDRTPRTLVDGNHLLGSTVIAFLTAKRSLIDLETLNGSWAVCRCSSEDVIGDNRAELMHHFAAASPARLITDSSKGRFGDKVDVLGTVANQLACFLSEIFGDVKPFTIAKGRHPEKWPTTPQDLIPYGVKSRNPGVAEI